MSLYELLLFLHVGAVIIWLGSGFLFAFLVFGAARAGDVVREAGYHKDIVWLAPRLFIPASLGSLVFGLLVTIEGDLDADQFWIVVGLVGWLVSFGLGFLYFKPEGERLGELIAAHGPTHPEVRARIRRLNVIDRLQLLVLFLVVAAMTIKPTGDDGAVLAVGAAILAAACVFTAAAIRRQRG